MKRVLALVVVIAVMLATWLVLRPAPRPQGGHVSERPQVAAPVPVREPEYPDTVLEARLRAIAERAPGHMGIVARNLANGAVARVNPDTAIPLMSVVKLPVAIVVLDGVDHGRWLLTTPIPLLPQDMHPRGWVGDRYPRGGGHLTLHRLLVEMLTRSDNSSADALMRLAGGPRAVTEWLERHDIHGLRVDRPERALGNDWYGLPPGADTNGTAEEIREIRDQVTDAEHDSAAQAMLLDPRDTGSPEACVLLLERLWRGKLLSAAMTDTLKSVLSRCRTAPHRLPGLLPRGTPVARKTGTGGIWRGVAVAINDVGVIRLPNGDDVAIAVLVGAPNGPVPRTDRMIARAARTVFDAWSGAAPVRSGRR
jgi:beta-lactamase class A